LVVSVGLAVGTLIAPGAVGAADYPPSPSDQSLDLDGFSTVCHKDAPFIRYEIDPVGFSRLC